jgi:RNA polymerase sigma-70 factor (ECF subfamily)
VQPPLRKRRQIRQDPRPDRPLVYERLSDPILVKRAKDGDEQALAVLCERHAPRVERLAAHVLADPEDARDAAQEALAKLCVRIRQFRGDSQFSTWLHRLVVNTCRDLADRQRLRRNLSLDEMNDPRIDDDTDPSRIAQLGDLRRELLSALGRLTAEQRRVVLLRDALDLPYDEIGRRVRIPVGTAKSYVHRGRENLRRRLQEYSNG